MSFKKDFKDFTECDIYSLIMFIMYKSNQLPEYSALSQLSFILDSKNLLNLCEYFGGINLHIPTIAELENYIVALTLYKKVHFDNVDFNEAVNEIDDCYDEYNIKEIYCSICDVIKDYSFN